MGRNFRTWKIEPGLGPKNPCRPRRIRGTVALLLWSREHSYTQFCRMSREKVEFSGLFVKAIHIRSWLPLMGRLEAHESSDYNLSHKSFCIRARLKPCRSRSTKNLGFSPRWSGFYGCRG